MDKEKNQMKREEQDTEIVIYYVFYLCLINNYILHIIYMMFIIFCVSIDV